MSPEPEIPLWEETAEERPPDTVAEVDGDTDLVIVGGGFTGLSTALHAAGRGLACHVLEAREIGFGGSGRNVGLVNAGLWLPPDDIRKRLGDNRGERLVSTLGAAPDYVMSLIERHQIRCEATRSGTIHAAHAPAGYDDLARRAEAWQRIGAPVDLLSREATADRTGSKAFFGGLLDRRAGTINPMGYVRGLARAAAQAGARISTPVTVLGLERQNRRWKIATDRGSMTARAVVLATNAYTGGLWPGLKGTFTTISYFQVATEPLGERLATVLRRGEGLWTTGRIMVSVRKERSGRLVAGSMGSIIGGDRGLSRRWAARTLRRLFPDLGTVRFETGWHGSIAMTPDHLPRIYRLATDLYTPIGYNGRGITTGTIFGKAIADLAAGGREEDLPVPITDPAKVRWAPVMSQLYRAAFAANQLVQSFGRR